MTKDDVIKEIAFKFGENGFDVHKAQGILYLVLNNYNITENEKLELTEYNQTENEKAYQMFIVSKKVEGCTDRTIKYYIEVLKRYNAAIVKPYSEVTTNDLRYYIACRELKDGISKCTANNERRVLSTFFTWLTANDYIVKNPMLAIKAIKQEKRIKKPFTEEELELIRRACKNKKELAIVEFFYSTGCRCEEVSRVRIEDVDFANGKLVVFGKGQKEREVFINAKCNIALKEYLEELGNTTEGPLFESQTYKGQSMRVAGFETRIREIGKRAGVKNCHPHRFRRTTATTALNRGMPIEQVRMMLGHEDIKTTTIYAIADKETLQQSHKKYVV